jgi:hypothetical protein
VEWLSDNNPDNLISFWEIKLGIRVSSERTELCFLVIHIVSSSLLLCKHTLKLHLGCFKLESSYNSNRSVQEWYHLDKKRKKGGKNSTINKALQTPYHMRLIRSHYYEGWRTHLWLTCGIITCTNPIPYHFSQNRAHQSIVCWGLHISEFILLW